MNHCHLTFDSIYTNVCVIYSPATSTATLFLGCVIEQREPKWPGREKAALLRWGLRLMRLIVAVQEANESEPRVKLSGNHTAPKKPNVTSPTPNKCRGRGTQTENESRAYATALLQQ